MLSFCQRFIMKIQSDNIGHKTRLRNRFVNEGMENFEPHEVLEVMLYKSFPYSDTNALAHRLIDRFGSFAAVLEAPYTELEKVEGMGRSSAITLSMWREFFRYYERSKRIGRNELCTVDRLPQIASALLKGSVTEEMHVLCLDVKSRLLGTVKISQNSPTFVSATVREIVERAFGLRSAIPTRRATRSQARRTRVSRQTCLPFADSWAWDFPTTLLCRRRVFSVSEEAEYWT